MTESTHLGKVINAFSNKDFKLTNSAITISSNIDVANPGTIIYDKDTDTFLGYVANKRKFNNSNFVPMNMDIATQSILGGIKIGNNLTTTEDGILNAVAESVSRKFQKVLIVSQSLQINGNLDTTPEELLTGDYRSINQCLKQFFDYNPTPNLGEEFFNGEISGLNKEQYPDPSQNNVYIILLTPGEYKESNDIFSIENNKTIYLPPYIALVGDDRDSCIINIKNLTSLKLSTGCILRNLTIDLTNANENLDQQSANEIIKGIELLENSENIIIENVAFKISSCNFNTSFVYSTNNNNIFLNNIILYTNAIDEANNQFIALNKISLNVIESNSSYINLNNCDLYLESNSHIKSIIKSSNLSLINCKSCKFEIKELNVLSNVSIENQVLYLIDSSYNASYSTFKCQGFDNNFTNTNIRNQGIRIKSTQNYNEYTSTDAVFIHDETNNSHDLIKVPLSQIDFKETYINGSRIKVSGTDNNNLTLGVSYIIEEIITDLNISPILGSVIGCDVSTNLSNEIINITDNIALQFKELFQANLYSCQVISDSETIYSDTINDYSDTINDYSDTINDYSDNYYINVIQTILNGVNPNIRNNTLVFNVPNEIIVGKENSNFNNIADALNSINNSNNINKVIVRVKPGTYLESKQLIIPEYVSLIGENSIIKFDVNSTQFPENVCVVLSSNTIIQDIEFIFDKAQDNTKPSIAFATSNFELTDIDTMNNELNFNTKSTLENIILNNIKISILDSFIPNVKKLFITLMIIKAENVEFNNLKINSIHNITQESINATHIYSKLSKINFNNLDVNINGYIEDFNYSVIVNDASNTIINNPNIRTKINTNQNANNQSVFTLINTKDIFIQDINTLDLSVYNTLVLGGSVRNFVNNENISNFALFADYNSTLISVGSILEGLCRDQNDRFNNHPNSFLKTMNCYLLSSNGEIVAGISEVDQNGQPSVNFDSLHVGDPVGSLDGVIPRENVLVGIRVALQNQTGIRNVMMGVDVGVFQQSGENNVYLGYRAGRNNLRSDNIFIGSGVADEVTEGLGTIAIGKDTVSNANNLTNDIVIGNNTGTELKDIANAVIIGTNSMNTGVNSNNENIIVIGSNNVGNNLTTGKNNLSIGNESMIDAQSLSETIIIGHKGYQDIETGINNIAIGNNTGENMKESTNSIVIGNNGAKGDNTVSTENINNIMIGNTTGGKITTAKDNLLVGTNTGPSITTGSRNIIMGSRQQDKSVLTAPAPRLTTGNDNIILGTEAAQSLTTGSRNLILGNRSGDSLNFTNDNIILGYDSGNSLTGGGEGINKNIIIGNQSANIATTGNIIIIGHEAGKNLIGDDSLVIGNMAARNISGGRNTVIGNKAAGLSDSITNSVIGTDNVLVGTYSGYNISSGSYNIVFGSGDGSSIQDQNGFDTAGSGYSLQSGSKNFIAGFNAGRSLESGDENILVGTRAGYTLSSSNRNVIIGNNAGTKIGTNDTQTQSNNNMILGNDAGSEITIGNNLLFIGQSAGRFSTEGDNNTFIGNNSGENNKGNNNTYIGNQSGQNNNGDNNTMIGVNSGKYTDNANFNTFIGFEAGKGPSMELKNTGNYNTIIGYQAGSDITEGSQNLYLGYQSGQKNKFGFKNIAIGPNAGKNSSTSRSIFIGSTENVETGVGMITTGQLNLFIGTDTGVNNTIGEKNTFLGSHTGQNNTTGSGSIFIGVDAGQQNTIGNDNTFIGREAGRDIINGVNNIMIGKQAGIEAINGASENILIGTLAGSKTEINDSINIGKKSGENNETGTGNILIGPRAGQNFEQSRNNIMIGSNTGANFKPTGSNITLGENIYIGSEVGRDNISGVRNIVIGSDAFKSSEQGSGVIAIGFKAGANAGILSENVGGKTYDNTIIGFEAGSQGDYANKNVMIGAQSGRNIDNARKFMGNVLLGSESGQNSNLSINSIVLGSANKIGSGGENNVIAGTDAGENLGNPVYDVLNIDSNLFRGMNKVEILSSTKSYGEIIEKININDKILIDDGEFTFETFVSSIEYNSNLEKTTLYLADLYLNSSIINSGAKLTVLSYSDDENIGKLDISKSSSNTLMGNKAGTQLTIGSKNVALGDQTMLNNKIGRYNTVLGTYAGYNLKTDNNLLLGTKAGYNINKINTNISFNNININSNILGGNVIGLINFSNDLLSGVLPFGTVIELENTTANNNKKLKVINVIDGDETKIRIEGVPLIDELSVPDIIPDDIIINATSFNFKELNKAADNFFKITQNIDDNYGKYSRLVRIDDNIDYELSIYQEFDNVKYINISGSKFNDGTYYVITFLQNIEDIITEIQFYNSLYPEEFDNNVKFTSKTIYITDNITSRNTFQDFVPNSPIYSFLGTTKGYYRTNNINNKFISLSPVNRGIEVNELILEDSNIRTIIFTNGYNENIDTEEISDNSKRYKVYGRVEFINNFDGSSTIILDNPINISNITESLFFSIRGTINNNDVIIKITQIVGGSGLTFDFQTIVGSITSEVINTTLDTPVILEVAKLYNLGNDISGILSVNNIVNMNITHTLGQRVLQGCYLIDYIEPRNNGIKFSNAVLPVIYNRHRAASVQREIESSSRKLDIELKINKDFYNVDNDYLYDKSKHLFGYDFMFQTGSITNAGTLSLYSSNNIIHSDIKFAFKDIVSPCMIKLGTEYYLVKSNKYPFKDLEIDFEHSTLPTITDSSNVITMNSISCYQNSINLSEFIDPGIEYKILGGNNNHDINIKAVSDSSNAINKYSVYLDDTSNIVNYQSNNKLFILDSIHEDYGNTEPGLVKGYFKNIEILNANVNIINHPVPYSNYYIIIEFNELTSNISSKLNLFKQHDFIKIESDNYNNLTSIYEVNESNIIINNIDALLPSSLNNQTANIIINEFVGYDTNTSNARIDFEKIRQMTGEHSDFLRFIKVRNEKLIEEYAEVNKYPYIQKLDKGLNYSVDISVFDGNVFNSNILIYSKHIIPLKETVPNEYYGEEFTVSDNYAISLGEPVFEASNIAEEIRNINTEPKGFIDIFVNNVDNLNLYDCDNNLVIFTNSDQNLYDNTYMNITLEIDTSNIYLTIDEIVNPSYEEKRIGGIKYIDKVKPFNCLKPGNIIYFKHNNTFLNSNISTSSYLINKVYDDGLTVGYDSNFNNTLLSATSFEYTSNVVTIELGKIDMGLNNNNNIVDNGAFAKCGHIINERFNFANFSNITLQQNSGVSSTEQFNLFKNTKQTISIIEYPILCNDFNDSSTEKLLNYINYTIPDWGIRPYTKFLSSYDSSTPLSTLDFEYYGRINPEQIILDNGNHLYIIPTSNISLKNGTNIFFKSSTVSTNENYIFNIDNYTIENGIGSNIDFTRFINNQIIRLYKEDDNIEIIVKTHLLLAPTTTILYLDTDYETTGALNNSIFGSLGFGESGEATLNGYKIWAENILSSNPLNTDLSVYKTGSRLIVSDTENNNQIVRILPSISVSNCLLVDKVVIDEIPIKCKLEKIILTDEQSVVAICDVDNINNKLTIVEPIPFPIEAYDSFTNVFNSFTKGQKISIINLANENIYENSVSNINYPNNTELFLQNNISLEGNNLALGILKNVNIYIYGKPIGTRFSNSLFHYEEAEGNNVMIGSFAGQFCGSKSLAIHNTYIGNKVGQTNHGSGNLFLGNESGFANNETDGESFYDNKFAIYKNNFIGVPNKPLIGGDFGSGRVGINTINPDTLLSGVSESDTKLVVNGAVRASGYSPFTGLHIIKLHKSVNINKLEPGMIVSTIGNVIKYSIIDTVVECKITDKERDKCVYGVYYNREYDGNNNLIYYVAGVGEGQIWVSNINGDIEAGDYVCSSNISGYCMKQDDDITHNYSVAKITETIDWDNKNMYKYIDRNNAYKVALLGCVYLCS